MVVARSLLYGAIFYIVTALWVLGGIVASLFGQRPTLAVVLSWAEIHHWLARHILGIHVRVEGRIPPGPHLIAVKHESMFETLEMMLITNAPVIVIKRELADFPLFGLMTRRYGIIAVERSAGAKALRALRLVAASGTVTPGALADLGIFDRAELWAILGELERAGMIREEGGELRAHGVWAAAVLGGLLAAPVMSER